MPLSSTLYSSGTFFLILNTPLGNMEHFWHNSKNTFLSIVNTCYHQFLKTVYSAKPLFTRVYSHLYTIVNSVNGIFYFLYRKNIILFPHAHIYFSIYRMLFSPLTTVYTVYTSLKKGHFQAKCLQNRNQLQLVNRYLLADKCSL